ncbi:MAG: hypothetical protein ACRD0P_21265, partial [Stackebrandtia sp.]
MILSNDDLRDIDARLSANADIVAAASQLVYDRRNVVEKRDNDEEADQVRAIVPYVDLARRTLANARTAINGRQPDTSVPDVVASKPPRNKSEARQPCTGRVIHAMTDVLSELCTTSCTVAELFDDVDQPPPGAGRA